MNTIYNNKSYSVEEHKVEPFFKNICSSTEELCEFIDNNTENMSDGVYLHIMNIIGNIRKHVICTQLLIPNTGTIHTTNDNNEELCINTTHYFADFKQNKSYVLLIINKSNINNHQSFVVIKKIMQYTGKQILQIYFNKEHIDSKTLHIQSYFTFKIYDKRTNTYHNSVFYLPTLQTTNINSRYNNTNKILLTYISGIMVSSGTNQSNGYSNCPFSRLLCNSLITDDLLDTIQLNNHKEKRQFILKLDDVKDCLCNSKMLFKTIYTIISHKKTRLTSHANNNHSHNSADTTTFETFDIENNKFKTLEPNQFYTTTDNIDIFNYSNTIFEMKLYYNINICIS